MNDDELATHDYITEILDRAHDNLIGYPDLLAVTDGPLRSFRARCPRCSSLVSFTKWAEGLRGAKCKRCPARWKEAEL